MSSLDVIFPKGSTLPESWKWMLSEEDEDSDEDEEE
jgi:hypothetical protein